jgi:hypothetical protein
LSSTRPEPRLASERDKDRVYQLIGEHLRGDANGVTQMAYVGVINPLNPRVESPQGGQGRPGPGG